MKKICLILIALLFTLSGFGQTRKGKVLLKNGSVLKGKITEIPGSESIQIKSSGNLWVFSPDQVKSIDYFPGTPVQNLSDNETKISNHTQIGILAGNSDNSQPAPFFLHAVLNYQVDDKIRAGIGSGVEFLKETHLPVFANLEYRFHDAYFSPYIFFKAGYTFPIEDSRMVYNEVVPDYYYYSSSSIWPGYYFGQDKLKAKGGLLLNPGFGISSMFSNNFGMTFSVGYRFTRLHYDGEGDYRLDVDFNRLSLTLGIIFN